MGIWYPRITCTWIQTDYFELFLSYWAVNSRTVPCLQLQLGHSPVPGVADAARREEGEQQSLCFPWASWDASWLLSCVPALPCLLLVALEREAFALLCFWDTWNAEKVKFLGRWACKGRVGFQSFPEGHYPCWNRHLLKLFVEQKPPAVLCVLDACDRPSHKWHSLHGILSAAGLQFWIFFPLNNLRESHHRKCKFSGNFTVLDFVTSAEQAAAKQIIPSPICDFVLLAWHEFGHDVSLWAGSFRCWWGQRCWEGVEVEKNDERDLQLLVNQSQLQRGPIATGNW